jgi:hypothetical protein
MTGTLSVQWVIRASFAVPVLNQTHQLVGYPGGMLCSISSTWTHKYLRMLIYLQTVESKSLFSINPTAFHFLGASFPRKRYQLTAMEKLQVPGQEQHCVFYTVESKSLFFSRPDAARRTLPPFINVHSQSLARLLVPVNGNGRCGVPHGLSFLACHSLPWCTRLLGRPEVFGSHHQLLDSRVEPSNFVSLGASCLLPGEDLLLGDIARFEENENHFHCELAFAFRQTARYVDGPD